MAELKTKPNNRNVKIFLNGIPDLQKRRDAFVILDLMRKATGAEPQMWGSSIVGFGGYHYRYGSGREGDWFLTGFSPRSHYLTLYIMSGFDRYGALLKKLGRPKTGKACLYLNRLDEIDLKTLGQLIKRSVKDMINYRHDAP